MINYIKFKKEIVKKKEKKRLDQWKVHKGQTRPDQYNETNQMRPDQTKLD